MLPNYTDYVFTTIPTNLRNCIRGGKAGESMSMTHEEWHWMNEVVRTLEYMGSYRFAPFGVVADGSTAKDNVLMMAPSRSKVKDWMDRVDAVVTRRFITSAGASSAWGSSFAEEDVGSAQVPIMDDAGIAARCVYYAYDPLPRPDTMAPSRSLFPFAGKITEWGFWLVLYADSRNVIFFLPYSLSLNSNMFGYFGSFFQTRNQRWECNGVADTNPESSDRLARKPFFYDRPTVYEWAKASTYFKEVSDKGTFVFANEQELGYSFPSFPWRRYSNYKSGSSSKDETIAEFYFAWGFLSAPLWKCIDSTSAIYGQYAPDARRSWMIYYYDIPKLLYGYDETRWGLFTRTVKDEAELMINNSGYDPSQYPTRPRGQSSSSGWAVVGYQLYAYPAAVIARASTPHRYVGEEV